MRIIIRFAKIPGRSSESAQKWHVDFSRVFCRDFAEQQNSERLKNLEDGSDFADFLTKSIASTRTKIFRMNETNDKFSKNHKNFGFEVVSPPKSGLEFMIGNPEGFIKL